MLNWAQEFITLCTTAVAQTGGRGKRPEFKRDGTPPVRRKGDRTDRTRFARPGRLNTSRVTGG